MENYAHEFITPTDMLDIRLEYTKDPGNNIIGKHFHNWIEIVYLINGDFINPMCVHPTKCKNGNEAILFQIPISFLEKFVPDIRDYQFQVDGYIFRCYSLIFELIYVLVHSFLVKIASKEKVRNEKNAERLIQIEQYVKEHYIEHPAKCVRRMFFSCFVKKFVQGVNLGNWLVLEKWMNPAMFEGTNAKDEYYLVRELPKEVYEARIKVHRREYITERDFAQIKSYGLNAVRIPVPFFIFGDCPPYIGCVEELDKAFNWAERYGNRKNLYGIQILNEPLTSIAWDTFNIMERYKAVDEKMADGSNLAKEYCEESKLPEHP